MRGRERASRIARPDTRLGARKRLRDACRRAFLLLVIGAATLVCTPPAAARNLKLWPFFEYQSDAAAGTSSVKLLGPLIEYRSDPDYLRLAFRPLLSIRQSRIGHDDEVRILYPLITSRWGQKEQTTIAAGGLVRYRTRTTADGKTLTSQHFRAVPVYFYDWDAQNGTAISVAPFYADVEDFLGYDRVEMVAFPLYLHLYEAPVDRRYALFPFFETVNEAEGSAVRFWPFYGRRTIEGYYDSGFVLWPFYVWDTRSEQGKTEERFMSFPFYARTPWTGARRHRLRRDRLRAHGRPRRRRGELGLSVAAVGVRKEHENRRGQRAALVSSLRGRAQLRRRRFPLRVRRRPADDLP